MYGAPNTLSPSTWNEFADLPKSSVSRSVYGDGSTGADGSAFWPQLVFARNSEPAGGAVGTSRKKKRQSPDSDRHVQSFAPKKLPLSYSSSGCAAAGPPNVVEPRSSCVVASWPCVAATATEVGMTIFFDACVSTTAPWYMPYGVPAGTVNVASNEVPAAAVAGALTHDQRWFS